jgi:hypothetical protein
MSAVLAKSANVASLIEKRIRFLRECVLFREATIRAHCTLKPANCQFASAKFAREIRALAEFQ